MKRYQDWKPTDTGEALTYRDYKCFVSPAGKRFEWSLSERGLDMMSGATIWLEHYRGYAKTIEQAKEEVEEALAEEIAAAAFERAEEPA
jgi:hypothetical protein